MKIITICTASHDCLLDLWLSSSAVDPLIEPCVYHLNIDSGAGEYNNPASRSIFEAQYNLIRRLILENLGSDIGYCATDVVFLKPFVRDVERRLFSSHALFQRERAHDELLNPDVMFFKCTLNVLGAWDRWLSMMPQWDGHLPHQNALMRNAFYDVPIEILPAEYAATDNGGLKGDPFLFHANCTKPPNSVQKKLALMTGALHL